MSYFVESFDTKQKRDCLIWARDGYDSGDRWGWAMSWLFDIAGTLYMRGIDLPELEYRPGAGGPDIDPDRGPDLDELTDEALIWAALVLDRYRAKLDDAGFSY